MRFALLFVLIQFDFLVGKAFAYNFFHVFHIGKCVFVHLVDNTTRVRQLLLVHNAQYQRFFRVRISLQAGEI